MLTNNSTGKWEMFLIIAIALCIIYTISNGLISSPVSVDRQNNQMVDRQVDSLRAWAKQLQHNLDSTNHLLHTDSIRYTVAESKLSRVPQMIQQINNRHAIQIHHIDSLPDNEQSALFSDWITPSDSL